MKTFWIHWWGRFSNVLSNHLSFFKYLLKMEAHFNCVFSVLGSASSFSVSFELSSQEASLEISHRIPVFICVISLQHVCVVQPGQTRLWGHSQNGRLLFASSCWLMSIIYCWEFRDIIGFISCFSTRAVLMFCIFSPLICSFAVSFIIRGVIIHVGLVVVVALLVRVISVYLCCLWGINPSRETFPVIISTDVLSIALQSYP